MHVCYVDESGDAATVASPTDGIQPVLSIVALFVDSARVAEMSDDLIRLKQRFYPAFARDTKSRLGWMLREIKGADLREQLRSGTRRSRRHALGVMDHALRILERHEVQLVGRVWVKPIGEAMDGTAVYTSSVQRVCDAFQRYLSWRDERGIVILDSRSPAENAVVAHSVFTQQMRSDGDPYDRLVETPTFGHSQNHSGLQFADLVASALVTPVACLRYCTGHVTNVHVSPRYDVLVKAFGQRLEDRQFRWWDVDLQRMRGGLTVSDRLGRQGSHLLFQ